MAAAGRPGRRRRAGFARARKRLNLALQGGGAHGAFTWGVLDRLLEDGRVEIDGISGTSAGAMNAVMLADGLARGGPQEACKRLAEFWRAGEPRRRPAGAAARRDRPAVRLRSARRHAGAAWFDALSRYWSPYDLNPLNINPLKDLIERFVDFDALRALPGRRCSSPPPMSTPGGCGCSRARRSPPTSVMASACLPMLFHAVEIDGVPYWDGGYLGNPAIFPFFDTTETEDVLLVQINPRRARHDAALAREIMDRLNEITFNSSLLSELRAINFVDPADRPGRAAARHRARRVPPHPCIASHSTACSKLPTTAASSTTTSTSSRSCAGRRPRRARFLDEHFDDIGQRSTSTLPPRAAPTGVSRG